ncbi:MAG: acyloxyacyl hydrolase [Bacteroidetes bacterium]|nr:acyloxyacyl hydrolase [Bacteroidota bacterium]
MSKFVWMRQPISILIIFISQIAFSQTDSSQIIYDLSARFLYSSIWSGRGSLHQFTLDHPWGMQLDFGLLKNSQHAWNYCNCYSRNGVSIGYIDFANPDKLGNAFTVSIFAEPVLILRKRFSLSLRGNTGFAFLSKVYDSLTNKESIFFSAKFSYYLAAGLNASYQLNKNLNALAGVQFNHISNGGRRDPNEGMNFPSINFSIDYIINPQKLERRAKEKFNDKIYSLMIHVFGAQRPAQASSLWPEEKRMVTGASVGLIKRIGRFDGIGAGGEIYYDGINSVYQQRSGQTLQTTVGGASIQHYLFFGKLLFGQQFAWYLTPNTGYQRNIYQRYFLEYEVKKNWYAGISLKAHGNHSDYMAFSTGYYFKI